MAKRFQSPITKTFMFFVFLMLFHILLSAKGLQWAKAMGGTSSYDHDYAKSIAVDSSGNVYTTGYFYGTVDFNPGTGVFNLTSAGVSDIFISKLDASGNFVWAKAMGGTSTDLGYSIAVDGSGNVYTTGYFCGTADFNPNSGGVFNFTSTGYNDIFVTKTGIFNLTATGGSGDSRALFSVRRPFDMATASAFCRDPLRFDGER